MWSEPLTLSPWPVAGGSPYCFACARVHAWCHTKWASVHVAFRVPGLFRAIAPATSMKAVPGLTMPRKLCRNHLTNVYIWLCCRPLLLFIASWLCASVGSGVHPDHAYPHGFNDFREAYRLSLSRLLLDLKIKPTSVLPGKILLEK